MSVAHDHATPAPDTRIIFRRHDEDVIPGDAIEMGLEWLKREDLIRVFDEECVLHSRSPDTFGMTCFTVPSKYPFGSYQHRYGGEEMARVVLIPRGVTCIVPCGCVVFARPQSNETEPVRARLNPDQIARWNRELAKAQRALIRHTAVVCAFDERKAALTNIRDAAVRAREEKLSALSQTEATHRRELGKLAEGIERKLALIRKHTRELDEMYARQRYLSSAEKMVEGELSLPIIDRLRKGILAQPLMHSSEEAALAAVEAEERKKAPGPKKQYESHMRDLDRLRDRLGLPEGFSDFIDPDKGLIL